MAEYSEPKFVSVEDILLIHKTDNKTTAICQCPLPIMFEREDGVKGGYCHVVEYEKEYTCKKCGLTFSVGKACWDTDFKN